MKRIPCIPSDGAPAAKGRHAATGTFLLLLVAGLTLAGCGSDEQVSTGTSVAELTGNAQHYYGRTVTVSGEIDEIYNARTFSLDGEGLGADDLLVLSVDSVPMVPGRTPAEPFAEGDIVQVTGVLEPLVRADVEEAYGIGVDEELAVNYQDRPVLIARSTASIAEPIVVTPRTARESDGMAGGEVITDLGAISRAPDEAQGRRVSLQGASVGEVVNERIFWVTSGAGERLLVVLSEPPPADSAFATGDRVDVDGMVEAAPPEAEINTAWGLEAPAAERVRGEQLYVRADRVGRTGGV